MTGWWRANAVALGALVILVPATWLIVSWNEWADLDANTARRPLTLEPGASIEYAGATIGPVTGEHADRPLTPEGTRVVTVTVPIDPGAAAFGCSQPTLHEQTGARREWQPTEDVGREWDSDRHTLCDSELRTPYMLELDYLVPADASGPFALEVFSSDAGPEFVSAVVEP